jgi:hypothetical protein
MLFTISGLIVVTLLIYSMRFFSKSQLIEKNEDEEIFEKLPSIHSSCSLKIINGKDENIEDHFKGY